jgi:hypothetical protein
MLKDIATLIINHRNEVQEGTLFLYDLTVTEQIQPIVQFLESKNAIENSNYETAIGKVVNLELTLARLNSVGYYEDIDALIRRNRYEYPADTFYIKQLIEFSDEANAGFLIQFRRVIEFIDSIKQIAKHTFQDIDIEVAVISREDKSVILPLDYSGSDVLSLSEKNLENLVVVTSTFLDTVSEKKLLFINELIEEILSIAQTSKFSTILHDINGFTEKCTNAYQFYLRDFSYNKLKIELDSKALEFTQKIQSVINDSQTKLVAIPTAFVLVFAAFDFTELYTVKDVVSIISLFIFALIIQIFLNNQHSTLSFIKANIESYKSTFKQSNAEKYSEKFKIVDKELTKQRRRLSLVAVILWLIPIALLTIWGILLYGQYKVITTELALSTLVILFKVLAK